VIAGSAVSSEPSDLGAKDGMANLVVTDPPYFDYISYDRLSAFYRSWFEEDVVAGQPILPTGTDPRQSFGTLLGAAFAKSASLLTADGLLAFTYHSSSQAAWEALGIALDEAKLRVTALWPVLADPHMGHHGTSGACQYDLVIVTRHVSQVEPSSPTFGTAGGLDWLASLGLELPTPDRMSALYAYEVLGSRWATVADHDEVVGGQASGLAGEKCDT